MGNIANINCLTINGGGKVFGNISAEKVIILDNGCIEGDLSCKMLQMGFSGSIIGRMYVHPLGGGKYESPETTLRKDMSKGGAKKRRNSVVNTIIVLNDGSTGERMNIEANTPRDWDDITYDCDDYETDQSMMESDTAQRLSDDNRVEKRDYNIPSLVPHYIPGGGGSLSERTGIRTTIAHPLANQHIDDSNKYGSRMKKDGIASSPTKKKIIPKDSTDNMKRRDSNGNSVVSQHKIKDTVPRRKLSLSEKRAEKADLKAEKAELKAEKAELKELKREEKRLEELKTLELARIQFEEEAELERQAARVRVAEKIAAEEKEWIEKEEKKIREEVERDMAEKAKIEEANNNLLEAKRQMEEEEFLLMEKQRREEDEKKRDEKEKEKVRVENEWKAGEDKKKKEKEEKKFIEDEARRKEIEMIERIERKRDEANKKNKDDKEKKKREDEKLRMNQNQNQNQNQRNNQVVPGMKTTKVVSDTDDDTGEYDDENWDEKSEKRR